MEIRPATIDDAGVISEIYNFYVRTSTATYQEQEESLDDRVRWMHAHGPAHPVIVAIDDGLVAGWASLNPYHARSAYRFTVENSIYIHARHHRRGIGRALLVELIRRGRELGHHSILAGISADQDPSFQLHFALGFREVARLREVGFKFNRWLDVIYMQLMLPSDV